MNINLAKDTIKDMLSTWYISTDARIDIYKQISDLDDNEFEKQLHSIVNNRKFVDNKGNQHPVMGVFYEKLNKIVNENECDNCAKRNRDRLIEAIESWGKVQENGDILLSSFHLDLLKRDGESVSFSDIQSMIGNFKGRNGYA